ncbi:MAG: protocatechuate 3,4-dioxygenase subunit beta [Polyangiales bacterium]
MSRFADHADHPPFSYAAYKSSVKRGPREPLVEIAQTLSERTGPGPAYARVEREDADLTTNAGTGGAAIGERIIVTGQVRDQTGRPLPNVLIELWQANASGRYVHWRETAFPAPLDPNFVGVGQCITDADGVYRFQTIKPGAYPWGNHPNAWRPAHIHFSLLGPTLNARLITQMYFPHDPQFALDPIYQAVPARARERLVAAYDHGVTKENWALGYRWDITLFGAQATPTELGGAR